MTFTQSSTRASAITLGVAALVAVALSVAVATPASAAVCPGTTFSTNLKMGASGASVMALQQFLNMSADTQVAATGAGSPGSETTYFGALTKAAVNKFQLKYAADILTPNGLTAPTGNFYASSRAKASAICAGSTGGTTTTPGTAAGTAVVSAAAQPANTVAPKSAARVAFTAFTVMANGAPVTLNSVTVQRQGPSVDTDFAGVVLIDASTGVQLGIARVLDSNHNATIGSPIVIPAGSSKTFWVAGNIASSPSQGDIASFAVTAINTASTVSGSLPIVGASHTINSSLIIGTAQVQNSSFDPNSATSQPIGTTGYRFSGVRINAGSTEDVTFKSITWYQSGSASGMQNVMTVVNGTSYPTTADVTGRYYTTVFPNGIVIPKGNSVDAYVQADLGANTTASTVAQFDIYRNTDIYVVGNQFGYGITPTISSFGTISTASTHGSNFAATNTGNPFFQGSTVSVTAGTFSTIQNATSVGAQNVAVNVPNQPLGGFQTNLTGEGITVQSLKIHLNYSSGTAASSNLLTNVSLVNENGAVVAGPFDATDSGGTSQLVTFTGSINFPVGTHTYTIKGKLPTTLTTGVTVQASTTPSSDWTSVTGDTTGNNITPSVGLFTMSTMTVKAAGLSIANSSSPTSQTVVSGGNVIFANYTLDASQSGEDVRFSSLPITFAGTGSATTTLSNCQIWDGTTALNTGSRVLNGTNLAASFSVSFDNALTVSKGTTKTLAFSCTVATNASGTYQFALGTPSAGSVTGVTSGSSVTVAAASGTAPTMTVSSGGSLTASTDSSAPSYTLVAGGTSGVTANVIKFRASNEAVNLKMLGLTLTNSASSSPADVTMVTLKAGNNIKDTNGAAIAANTVIGTATFLGSATVATSTLNTMVQLPKDQDATIVVSADIADIGSNQPGTEGHLVAIDYLNSEATGVNSGSKVYGSNGITAGTGVAGLRTFNTFPTVAVDTTLPSTGVADGRLMQFKVTANSAGSLGIYNFKFTLATSSATVSNVQLFAYTDSNYSQAVSGTFGASTGQVGSTVSPASVGNTFNITATTNPVQVSAGQTVYFQLKGTVSPSSSTYNVVTTLVGDSSYPSLAAFMAQASAIGTNFVWSPNATSTASFNSNDWTNGYGVSGLPSGGLFQNRSN
jgi:hypothetical protein